MVLKMRKLQIILKQYQNKMLVMIYLKMKNTQIYNLLPKYQLIFHKMRKT